MLNNHLISIQSVYKLCFLLFIISCANVKTISQRPINTSKMSDNCKSHFDQFEGNNLVKVAQIKSSIMKNCFLNYLRFEKEKKQTISTCNQLSISRRGKVNYVQVTDLHKKRLPKDLQMCIKQEFWKMDFRGLQLGKSYVINFPLTFASK